MKIIHTGLFSDNAMNIMRCIKYTILNGQRSKSRYAMNVAKIKMDMNNEIIIEIDDTAYNYRYSSFYAFEQNNSNFTKDVLNFLAIQLKFKIINNHAINWDRNNIETVTLYDCNENFEFSIQDIYYIYDALKGRKNLKNKYPVDVISKMHGEEYDPILTEQNKIVHDEIFKLEEEMNKKIKENSRDFNYKYQKIWKEKEDIETQIRKDFAIKKHELLNSINLMKNMISANL